MKKLLVLFLAVICIITLCCCKETIDVENPDSKNHESVFDSVPDLIVACTDKSVKALKGTTTWTYTLDNGTGQSFCSDSAHPLQAVEYMEPLSLLPSQYSRFEPLAATLMFDKSSPDKVTVRCWDESCIDKPDSPATEIEVQAIEVDFADGTYGVDYTCDLLDGNYIYEVIAEWNTNESCNGVVHYSFYTLKPDMTTYPIDNVQKK